MKQSMTDRQETHYAGCWRDPKHHDCAVRRIEELEAEHEQDDWLAELAEEAAQWVEPVKRRASKAQLAAERRYNRTRSGKQVGVRLTVAQDAWLQEHMLPGESRPAALRRLSGMPE